MAENPSITVAVVTVTGEAMKLESGSCYVIEFAKLYPADIYHQLREWAAEQGVKLLILGPDAKLKREPEPCNLCETQAGLPFCSYCGRKLKL